VYIKNIIPGGIVMNRKSIKAVLAKKHKELCSSVKDEKIRKILEENIIITGGCITSMLLGEEIKDFDMYFTNKKACEEVTKYYVEQFNSEHPATNASVKVDEETGRIRVFIQSAGVAKEDGYLEDEESNDDMQTNITPETDLENIPTKPAYRPVYLTSNAITLSNKVQLVIRFYGEAEEIHKNYDFVHCTNYWESKNKKLTLRQEALEAILAKELKYVGSKYPLCSIIRTRKFIQRGWTINAGQYLKMCMQLNELNLKDIKVLEDQLVGVDSGYFSMLISALEKKKEQDPEWNIENNYVAAVVDKIF
jgi:hypothetical protein